MLAAHSPSPGSNAAGTSSISPSVSEESV